MKSNIRKIDWSILIPTLILLAFSLVILFAVDPAFFRSQLVFAVFSLVVFFVVSQIEFSTLSEIGKPIYIVSLCLLVLVLVIGLETRGAVRWVTILGVQIQFSEILKPFLLISLAKYVTTRELLSIKTFFMTMVFLSPIALLIARQPDLGNALIYVGVTLLTLIIFGIPFKWLLASSIPVLLTMPFLWPHLHDYQQQRILTFFNPASNTASTSYNVIQAIIAVGSGRFLGRGLNEGTQSSLKFLPENHTDFIFATLSERLGFLGTAVLLLVFGYLFYRIYVVFKRCDDPFGKVLIAGCFCVLFVHFFVNVGMNIGILPVVGVTLPFVSYGGSSLLSNFIILALISSVSIANKKDDVLQIR